MSNIPAFPAGTVHMRPRVALSTFTMLLGDIMRNLRVERNPKSIASPRPTNTQQQPAQPGQQPAAAAAAASTANPQAPLQSEPHLSLLPDTTEAIFRSMGVDVGMRTVAHISDIAILPGTGGGGAQASGQQNQDRSRPASFLDAAKFIATHCWEYWFDHAPYQKFQHLEAFYIDEYESLSCFPFSGPGKEAPGAVNEIQFSTFVQGMIEGAMRACGYPVVVNFSQADEQGLQQYQILPLKLPPLPL